MINGFGGRGWGQVVPAAQSSLGGEGSWWGFLFQGGVGAEGGFGVFGEARSPRSRASGGEGAERPGGRRPARPGAYVTSLIHCRISFHLTEYSDFTGVHRSMCSFMFFSETAH